MKISEPTLHAKFTLIHAAGAVATILIGAFIIQQTTNSLLEERIQAGQGFLSVAAENLEEKTRGHIADVQFLSSVPPIQGLLRTRSAGGRSGLYQGADHDRWAERLGIIFSAVSSQRASYRSLRYVDGTGKEWVRVDSAGGSPEVSAQPHIEAVLRTPRGEVYVSEITPASPRGTASMWIGSPVFDDAPGRRGARRGGVLIEVDLRGLAHDLSIPEGEIFLADAQGYFLHHPDASREFGRGADTTVNLFRNDPAIGEKIRSTDRDMAYYPSEDRVDGFEKVRFDPYHTDRHWILYGEIPGAILFSRIEPLRRRWVFLGSVSLFLMTFTIFALSRSITSPLRSLARTSDALGRGD